MLAAFVYWYGLLTPLRLLGDEAERSYDKAAADIVLIRQQADALARLRKDANGPTATVKAILEAAESAGIAITSSRLADGGVLEIEVDDTSATRLFSWFGALRETHRLSPRTLHVERRGSGVAARFNLELGPGDAPDREE